MPAGISDAGEEAWTGLGLGPPTMMPSREAAAIGVDATTTSGTTRRGGEATAERGDSVALAHALRPRRSPMSHWLVGIVSMETWRTTVKSPTEALAGPTPSS
mmetsp:Transcript_6072/g.13092  ORF Transcript_6072/g.13092 Transcript_6072/m.13092 type:complete len:102 (-) Transcript_6072:1171-1476(-)